MISGGDRGFTPEHEVELLREIRPTLQKGWGLTQSAVILLRLLISVGLLQEVGELVTFFHDSFESYFAARALQVDIGDRWSLRNQA